MPSKISSRMTIPSRFGHFKTVDPVTIPNIQRHKREGVISSLEIFKDFEAIITTDHAPFEALCVDLADYQEELKPLKNPRQSLLAACRVALRKRGLANKYTVMLRESVMYVVDSLAAGHINTTSHNQAA